MQVPRLHNAIRFYLNSKAACKIQDNFFPICAKNHTKLLYHFQLYNSRYWISISYRFPLSSFSFLNFCHFALFQPHYRSFMRLNNNLILRHIFIFFRVVNCYDISLIHFTICSCNSYVIFISIFLYIHHGNPLCPLFFSKGADDCTTILRHLYKYIFFTIF